MATKFVVAWLAVGMLSRAPISTPDAVINRLVDAAATPNRNIEPRLTGGFPWAPLRRVRRDAAETPPIALKAVAAEFTERSEKDGSMQTRHASAIANLLVGNVLAATTMLERDAVQASNARVWSDLAATRYVAAIRSSNPSDLARALAAVDAAQRLDPALPEASFNRALILERLDLRELARDAWDAYLRLDPGSEWSNEARDHARNLLLPPVFKEELERNYDRLAADPASAHAFARQFREDSRRWGETEILGRWATAEAAEDHVLASKHLAIARELGAELARDRGDQMLQALVAAIDRASNTQRADLASAHLAFRDGQKAYQNHEPGRAEKILVSAATAFERGRSPGALLARYFAANTAYSLGRIDESGKKLEVLMAETPPEFIAHRAQILWQIGLVSMARTQWGYCIDTLSESAVLFERLDERTLAARIHQSLGTAYDQIGSPVEAEKHRMLALRGLGQQSSSRLQMLLTSLSLTAARDEDWPTAVSVFGLAIDVAKRVDDPLTEVSSRLRRARLHVRMNDRVAALADLNAARAGLHRVREPEYRLFLEANAMSIEAALASPESAIRLLTGAVDFHRARGQRMFLSELLLERGRAFRRIGDDTRAAEDFEQGVSELESRRETLAVDDRMGIFHEADGLFEEAIALALKNRRPKRAFDYAERARARALLDALGVVWQPLRAEDLPEDSVLLEYVTRADRIEIFVVDRSGVRVVERPVERVDLVAECAELVNAASAGDVARLRRAGRALHRRLVEPVEVEIIDKRNVVFVPDPKMGNVPFAALVDAGGRFLIERYPIEVVPSAAAFARLASERTRVDEPRTLIVTGADEGEPLPATEREADRVAAVYRRVTRLSRDLATRNAFAREAMRANVIHFAGHAAAGGAGGRDGYLRLKGGDAVDGQLGFREIAAMRLRNTDVVVLAACSTAAGEIRSSEGTISVARAFLAAGVPSVIATMWPIEDELAADFFPVIHGHISRGLAPAEALRAAQLDWIQRGNESAALWTAVQLVGH